jgi:hypothetical protein
LPSPTISERLASFNLQLSFFIFFKKRTGSCPFLHFPNHYSTKVTLALPVPKNGTPCLWGENFILSLFSFFSKAVIALLFFALTEKEQAGGINSINSQGR